MDLRLNYSTSLYISAALAIATWLVFRPGLLSVDSLQLIREARLGTFSDVRSPFVTMVLSLYLRSGGTISILTLCQCLLGFFGVRRLILGFTSLFSVPVRAQESAASLTLLVLSSPLTPMPVYFATFWLDTWLAILLLWTLALMLELAKKNTALVLPVDGIRLAALIGLISIIMLTRLNAPILYPALALGLVRVLTHTTPPRGGVSLVVAFPLLFFLLFGFLQHEVFGVKRAHQERIVFALDLASMLTYNPAICQTYALESCSIIQGRLSSGFIPGQGAIDHTLNQGLGWMEPAFVELAASPSLQKELWFLVVRHPWTFLSVKVLNFLDYVRPGGRYYFQSHVHPNTFGFFLDPRAELIRNKLFIALHAVYSDPFGRLISYVHLPWLVLNTAAILICLAWRPQARHLRTLAILLLVPATYSFSYLLALTASDFRFMYPSTLLTQVGAISGLAVLTFRMATVRRWHDRARRKCIRTIRPG